MRTGAQLLLLALGGCSVVSSPISTLTEKRLLGTRMSDAEFGARLAEGGQRIHFTMFTGEVSPERVVVPMSKRFRGLPGVEVELNERAKILMLADTGAQLSIVDAPSVLRASGRVYVPQKWDFSVTGIGGAEQAWLARFDRVAIGSLILRDFTTVVRRQQTLVKVGGLSLASVPINLLGCPVLLGFDHVTFDYARSRFVFSPGEAFRPGPNATPVPMKVDDQLLYVPLRIGRRTLSAMIDTGAKDQVFLNTETVRKLGMEAQAAAGGTYRAVGLGGETSGRQFTVPLMFLGGKPLKNVVVDTSDSNAWDVRIGTDLLARWKVTFDFRRRLMWLEEPGATR